MRGLKCKRGQVLRNVISILLTMAIVLFSSVQTFAYDEDASRLLGHKYFANKSIGHLPLLSKQAESNSMGRYCENEVELPPEIITVARVKQDADNQIRILAYTDSDSDSLVSYQYIDNKFVKDKVYPSLPYGCSDYDEVPGQLVVLHDTEATTEEMMHAEEDPDHELASYVDSVYASLDIDINDYYIRHMALAGPDKVLAQVVGESILVYEIATGRRIQQFDGLDGSFVVHEDRLFAISYLDNTIIEKDLLSGETLATWQEAPLTGRDSIAFDNERLYLANADGIFVCNVREDDWQLLLDGGLTSLNLVLKLGSMAVKDDAIYILLYDEDDGCAIFLEYQYYPEMPSQPEHSLRVCSLYSNDLLIHTAHAFQIAHPDYKVELEVLVGEDAILSKDDALRILQADLLAGKGPDLLLMDGLPWREFQNKGFLVDLSDFSQDLITSGEVVSGAVQNFSDQVSTYMFPGNCELPVLLTSKRLIDHPLQTDADLLDVLGSSEVTFPLPLRNKQDYFTMFLPSHYLTWFDESGNFQEKAFVKYLDFLDQLSEVVEPEDLQKRDYYLEMLELIMLEEGADKNGYVCDFDLMTSNEMDIYPTVLGSFLSSLIKLNTVEKMEGQICSLPGESLHIFLPRNLLAINAQSQDKEMALVFLQTMLSEKVQNVDLHLGLPLNLNALENKRSKDASSYGVIMGYMDMETFEPRFISGDWPDKKSREQVCDLLLAADTPCLVNDQILEIMHNGLEDYFSGQEDAEVATSKLAAKLRAYLAE